MRTSAWSAGLLVAMAATTAVAGTPRQIGFVSLERRGAEDPAYDSLVGELGRSIGTISAANAVDLSQVARCRTSDASCWIEKGRKASVEAVLHGSVERTDRGYSLVLGLADVASGQSSERTRLVAGGSPDLFAAVEAGVCDLLGRERCEGKVSVGGPEGLQLLVDGRSVGALPYRGSLPLGRHALRVEQSGRSTGDHYVRISYGQELDLQVSADAGHIAFTDDAGSDFDLLPPPPEPVETRMLPRLTPPAATPRSSPVAVAETKPRAAPLPQRAITTTAGSRRPGSADWMPGAVKTSAIVAGGAALLGLVAGALSAYSTYDANRRFDERQLTVADRELYDSARSRASFANIAYGVSALALVSAGAFYIVAPGPIGSGGDLGLQLGLQGHLP